MPVSRLAFGTIFFGFVCVAFVGGLQNAFSQPVSSETSPTPEERPLDLPALAKKARRAVVFIVCSDASGGIKTGSGFFVSEDGRLVTNQHVIEDAVSAQAKLESGAIYNIKGVLASSPALDLAVLKADARDVQFLSVDATITPPEPGTRIAVIGSPLAFENTLSDGIVSANREDEAGKWVQITAAISPGSSGSPVLDLRGRVIGVATLIAKQGQNVNFARSSQDLRNLLQTIHEDSKPKPLSNLASSKKDQLLADPDFITAMEANNRGDGATALKLLNALAERYSNEPRLLFQIAFAYESLGLHDEAYRSYRAYIDVNPTNAAAWHNLAVVALKLNRINEAINACTQTLKLSPDPDTWRLLGALYGAQGQYERGAYADNQAKRLESDRKNRQTATAETTSAPQGQRNVRPIYVVAAPSSKGLNIRADHSVKSTIIEKLHPGDQVILEEGRIRNDDPPSPVTWQKITSKNGNTGWINFDYLAPSQDAYQKSTAPVADSPPSVPAMDDTGIRQLFEKWLSVSNAHEAEAEASLYADPVDYLGLGALTRQRLVQELERDLQRWPNQNHVVPKAPSIEKLSDSEWRVTFEINFDARDPSKGKQITGTANLTWLVRKRESGGLEIASSKEQVTSRKRHDIRRSER